MEVGKEGARGREVILGKKEEVSTPRIFEFLFARIEAVILALFATVPFKTCLGIYAVVSICFSFIFLIVGRGNSKG